MKANLSDLIGSTYRAFNVENPYNKQLRHYPSNSNKRRQGRRNIRKIYLSPHNLSQIYGGLTLGKTGTKMCHTKKFTALRHSSSVYGCLLPSHTYLVLPGSHILHPLPMLNYKDLSEATLLKLLDASITIDNAENLRSSLNATPNMPYKTK